MIGIEIERASSSGKSLQTRCAACGAEMAYCPPERRFQCLTAGCGRHVYLTGDEVFDLFFRQTGRRTVSAGIR